MKILTITDYPASWPYVPELLENLQKVKDTQIGILDIFNATYRNAAGVEVQIQKSSFILRIPGVSKIYKLLLGKRILRVVEQDYDAVNIHNLGYYYILFAKGIERLGKKLIVTIWGSDLYRVGNLIKKLLNIILRRADTIVILNPETSTYFQKFYPQYKNKIAVLHYGLKSLAVIERIMHAESRAESKGSLGIAHDSLVISCAYNGSPGQQHLRILEAIASVKPQLPSNYLLVIPLTYATPAHYREKIEETLIAHKLKYKIFDKKLTIEDLARLRIASDILITMQITDQLSASIQEVLYCGNVVIAGAWLPYRIFEEEGIYFSRVASFEDLSAMLRTTVNAFTATKERCARNPQRIYTFSSWESKVHDWVKLYSA